MRDGAGKIELGDVGPRRCGRLRRRSRVLSRHRGRRPSAARASGRPSGRRGPSWRTAACGICSGGIGGLPGAPVRLREEQSEHPEVGVLRLRVALLALGARDRTSEGDGRLGAADEAAGAQRLGPRSGRCPARSGSRGRGSATGRAPASTTVPATATRRRTRSRMQPQRLIVFSPLCATNLPLVPRVATSAGADRLRQHRRQRDAGEAPDAVLLHHTESGIGRPSRACVTARPRPGPQDAGLLAQQARTDARSAG